MINYVVDLRCDRCGKLIAQADKSGGYILGGVHVDVLSGVCPECGEEFNGPGMTKVFSSEHLAEMKTVIERILENRRGFGELYVCFMKGKVAAIGERTERRFNLL